MNKVQTHIEMLRNYDKLAESEKLQLRSELSEVKILTPDHANAKTAKNMGKGYLSFILHLAPSDVSGYNVCPAASKGCKMACLNTAGRGRFQSIQDSRIRKTLYYIKVKDLFVSQLDKEITALTKKGIKLDLKPVVRLNGTSDIPWEYIKMRDNKSVFELHTAVQFYDYTKILTRLAKLRAFNLPNYHITFSRSEANDADCDKALGLGFNVATVFDIIPTSWLGQQVINGDGHDLRFLDEGEGVIVGLKAKGKAKVDTSGFVKYVTKSIDFKVTS